MANELIVEGLRIALAKGETMQQAMMTFFNAGYSKQEIEEAANILQQEKIKARQQLIVPVKTAANGNAAPVVNAQVQTVQKVSSYGSSKGKMILILKIFLFIIALGILAFALIFREDLMSFINNLF